jgi:hypothetical protein
MKEVSIIGLDLAKNVFHAHGTVADGAADDVSLCRSGRRRKLRRSLLGNDGGGTGTGVEYSLGGGGVARPWHGELSNDATPSPFALP